ncbi:ESPR-type extended signal peptide-containing protein, partial [Psychrobacter celer]|uniref:ESPR-type extended signal peptide-containing protein n=1 Tax=Psychrobacter celer TaxID=306572 RepID=UPI003FD50735
MNHFYKVVRCKRTGVFKAVPENAKSGKKSKSVSVAAHSVAGGIVITLKSSVKPLIISLAALGVSALSILPAHADYGEDSREMIKKLEKQLQDPNVTIGSLSENKNIVAVPLGLNIATGVMSIGKSSNSAEYLKNASDTEFESRVKAAETEWAASLFMTYEEYLDSIFTDPAHSYPKQFRNNEARDYAHSMGFINTAVGAHAKASSGGVAIGSDSFSGEIGTVSFGTKNRIDITPKLDEFGHPTNTYTPETGTQPDLVIYSAAEKTRRLTNVADGIAKSDVATVGQLTTAVKDLGFDGVFSESIEVKADQATTDAKDEAQDTAINTIITTNNNQDTAIQTNKNNININKNNITTNTNNIAQNKLDISKKADKTYVDAEDKKLRDTAVSNKQAIEGLIASTKSEVEAVNRTQNTAIASNATLISNTKTQLTGTINQDRIQLVGDINNSVRVQNTKNADQDTAITENTRLIGTDKTSILNVVNQDKADLTNSLNRQVGVLKETDSAQDVQIRSNTTLINTTSEDVLKVVNKNRVDGNQSITNSFNTLKGQDAGQDALISENSKLITTTETSVIAVADKAQDELNAS